MAVKLTNTTQTDTANETSSSNRSALRYAPGALWILAAILLVISVTQPYWGMVLQAPQYPGGLRMRVFVHEMLGDEDTMLDEVHEIDGLNHYIGMKSMYDAAKLERAIAIPVVVLFTLFLVGAAVLRRRWRWLLVIPPLTFPLVFLADLQFWLYYYGNTLDPYAPLSSAIKPFTPPALGEGIIGQFSTIAYVDTGWYIALAGSIAIAIGLIIYWHERRKATQG